ncbi:MAG: GCN5-related N-acetyltransferase [Hydrocarboniphaga sp.]|uniref:MSMEG_0567/Sll0786 family nitrogen starvation N-acetyltransferase n=1 Tax=Hydrocarboniphaga sp. TaxID=2033016 RepID=UPI00262FF165|nr:MSMEG_0567/Sll0786 family nitrogen starvation N-acetyltransferase [Hydrocarboniphaga sp.]MDB5967963.1 GCN5-related N-acetyltransferase [Hydrocarboniphaga sp.]
MLPFAPADCTAFPFVPGEYRIKHLSEAWERAACLALRRQVFCREQGLFEDDDRDARDAHALSIAAIACIAGAPEQLVGTVRIHCDGAPSASWSGSRLAVHPDFRRSAWLGSELIRHAVSTATARGCRRFTAQVQAQNRALFERLHWRALEASTIQNRPHVLMEADLACYAPRYQDEIAWYTAHQHAAQVQWQRAA